VAGVAGIVVEEQRGSAGALHAIDPFADGPVSAPQVWICVVDRPAIVLGSRQTPELLDLPACERAGLEIVRRRSGGGAVLLRPGAMVWIDLVLPHGAAPDDIRGSMIWAGRCWTDALVELGAATRDLRLHDGGMVCAPWSNLVCFAGVGPGEVLVGDRKLLGLSQRRSRNGVRIQCQVHRRPILGEMPHLFATTMPDVAPAEPAVLADIGLGDVTDATLATTLADTLDRGATPV
jgi:lipoate-protein ligase A